MSDPIQQFKEKQRQGWANFALLEMTTTMSAGRLVRFAGVKAGQKVLDVGCGTGVVAVTARREGARVTGLDLTPELLARAKEHSSVAGFEDIAWKEGDAEDLPYADGEFDVVLSQFGHMFAPRPEVATKEMLRVLKPGGTIAFNTWPPEGGLGSMFQLVGKFSGPPPAGASPPAQWGDVAIVRQRLGNAVRDLVFDREVLRWPAMSVPHWRAQIEQTSGPVINLLKALKDDPKRTQEFRVSFDAMMAPYWEPSENVLRFDYLKTRAVKL